MWLEVSESCKRLMPYRLLPPAFSPVPPQPSLPPLLLLLLLLLLLPRPMHALSSAHGPAMLCGRLVPAVLPGMDAHGGGKGSCCCHPCTLHTAHCTLHTAHCTLHPTTCRPATAQPVGRPELGRGNHPPAPQAQGARSNANGDEGVSGDDDHGDARVAQA